MRGRFAPSPTGALHLGNLRTALVAWSAAERSAGSFVVRVEDLDPVTSSPVHEAGQLRDLALVGLRWETEVIHQSERTEVYREAIGSLSAAGLVYPCYCTRREIRDAPRAPNADDLPDGAYPGTCRILGAAARANHERAGRRAALRLRTAGEQYTIVDLVAGAFTGWVDDVVLQRNDGVAAYNLAVVVDDHLQGVTQVVRGDDLATSTPRQVHLQRLLGYPTPEYAHLPLVLGPDGNRLAKRHGAVTLADFTARGVDPPAVRARLGASLGLCSLDERPTAFELAQRFSFDRLPRRPWQLGADDV